MTAALTPRDISLFAELSGDRAPLHTDGEFAKAAGFSGPLVHGALLVALVSRLVGMEFPGPQAVLARVDLSFRNPCYAPCDLGLTATVRQISEAVASLTLDIAISDGSGRDIASGRTWHRILDFAG
jgi:acyl dehydratase